MLTCHRSVDFPIFNIQAGNAFKFSCVVRHDDQSIRSRNCGDQHIVPTYGRTPPFQVGTNTTVLFGGIFIKR